MRPAPKEDVRACAERILAAADDLREYGYPPSLMTLHMILLAGIDLPSFAVQVALCKATPIDTLMRVLVARLHSVELELQIAGKLAGIGLAFMINGQSAQANLRATADANTSAPRTDRARKITGAKDAPRPVNIRTPDSEKTCHRCGVHGHVNVICTDAAQTCNACGDKGHGTTSPHCRRAGKGHAPAKAQAAFVSSASSSVYDGPMLSFAGSLLYPTNADKAPLGSIPRHREEVRTRTTDRPLQTLGDQQRQQHREREVEQEQQQPTTSAEDGDAREEDAAAAVGVA
jgi:hypothetical protein